MHTLANYGLFLAKLLTVVFALLILFAGLIALKAKSKFAPKSELVIDKLNEKFENYEKELQEAVLSKKEYKKYLKSLDKKSKSEPPEKKRLFILNFNGDIRASAVDHLREEITSLLCIATPQDEIIVRIESAGGMVHSYGLAASQLQRIKDKKIPLTACIDKVAASGGYLMACVADKLIASPFAIIGSIGVIAQLPNFNRWLKRNDIDFEQITAGKYKRTLTVFGENTPESRQKMQETLEEIHFYFKDFISQHRPQIDLERVATGEHWLAAKAFELNLIDKLQTSDDYLFSQFKNNQTDIFEIKYLQKQSLKEKLSDILTEHTGLRQNLHIEYR
jgi:serine protease SohB